MSIPSNLKYTKEHEWVEDMGDSTYRIGITDYAQNALGDIVYVELPDKDDEFSKDGTIVTVESVKAVSEVLAPFDCTIVETNESLEDEPELINSSAYKSWIVSVKADDIGELLSDKEYKKLLESE